MIVTESFDYRDVLQTSLAHMRETNGPHFTISNMADRAQVQKTYMSRALKKRGHLSGDQAYLACKFLRMTDDETEFVLLLLELEKTSIEARKENLKQKIDKLTAKRGKTESHLHVKAVQTDSQSYAEYYLDPLVVIIHLAMSVPKYAGDTKQLQTALALDDEAFTSRLEILTRLKFITKRGNKYELLKDFIHLPEDSPIFKTYAVAQRQKAIEHIHRASRAKRYNFSVTFSGDEQLRAWLHQQLLALLKKAEAKVGAAPAEGVYQMNFDLLKWV